MLPTSTTSVHQPNIQILGIESSYINKQGLMKKNIKYQLIPPNSLRRNAADHAIHTFKSNFITCIYAADPDYPTKYWDCFLPQENLTLNPLLQCNSNPKLSVYVDLHGIYDYNKKTL